MRANRAKDTSPELDLRKALRHIGIQGYRLNCPSVIGRPDICFVSARLAVFVHGCFWHRCPNCTHGLPKSNKDFWREKFRRNKLRDRRKTEQLKSAGWIVLTFWE